MTAPGTMILVVGASGAGKDSLLEAARAALRGDPRWLFPERVITRPPDYGGECHRAVDEAEFERLAAGGALALHWRAHGFRYGIPGEVHAAIDGGRSVVANVSRTIVAEARGAFARVRVVHVCVPEAVLRARLAARGRENEADVRARLARAARLRPEGPGVVEFVNDAPLERAASEFVALLDRVAS